MCLWISIVAICRVVQSTVSNPVVVFNRHTVWLAVARLVTIFRVYHRSGWYFIRPVVLHMHLDSRSHFHASHCRVRHSRQMFIRALGKCTTGLSHDNLFIACYINIYTIISCQGCKTNESLEDTPTTITMYIIYYSL